MSEQHRRHHIWQYVLLYWIARRIVPRSFSWWMIAWILVILWLVFHTPLGCNSTLDIGHPC